VPSEFVFPASLPRPLADPHEFEPVDIAASRPRDAGEMRREPLYRSVPQRLAVTWPRLTQPQFDTFVAWFEDELLAGARRFDVQVAAQGGSGPTWWTALFLRQGDDMVYAVDVLPGTRYRVAAKLLLLGTPFGVRVAPGIFASGTDGDDGSAYLQPGSIFASGGDTDDGGWYVAGAPIFASGEDTDDGGFNTDVEPAGADDDLMRVWMGLDIEPPLIEDEDALTAQAMGY
jgi:hypothetical protein